MYEIFPSFVVSFFSSFLYGKHAAHANKSDCIFERPELVAYLEYSIYVSVYIAHSELKMFMKIGKDVLIANKLPMRYVIQMSLTHMYVHGTSDFHIFVSADWQFIYSSSILVAVFFVAFAADGA